MRIYKLTDEDDKMIRGCHPILQQFVYELCKYWPVNVIEGPRTESRQKYLKRIGTSWTLNSPHLVKPKSMAVDIGLNRLMTKHGWTDTKAWLEWVDQTKEVAAAIKLKSKLTWGADWKTKYSDRGRDCPHVQIKGWKEYL